MGTILFTVSTYLVFELHTAIKPSIIILLIETNIDESTEFLSQYILRASCLKYLFLVIFIIAIIVFGEKRGLMTGYPFRYRHIITALTLVLLSFGVWNHLTLWSAARQSKNINNTAGAFGLGKLNWGVKGVYSDSISNLFLSINFLRYLHQITQEWVSLNEQIYTSQPTIPQIKEPLSIILILGESHSKLHTSEYGYPLCTTPAISREKDAGNLFVFNDMISPYSSTTSTIKNLMTLNSIGDGEQWNEAVFFPVILNIGGYEVSLWDNQNDFRSNNSHRQSWDIDLATFQTAGIFRDKCYSFIYGPRHDYDGEIIDKFLSSADQGKSPDFVWLHLMGQHLEAVKRYPPDGKWDYFKPIDYNRNEKWMTEKKKQTIAEYDNATRYVDFQINRIFDHYRDSTAVIIYLSDHGEEIYDYRNICGRQGNDAMTLKKAECLHEIPFIIWCSDKYKAKYPETVAAIEKSLNKPGMSDNIGHMIFHLAGLNIDNPYYKPSRDILSDSYSCPRRVINSAVDYDNVADYDMLRNPLSPTGISH